MPKKEKPDLNKKVHEVPHRPGVYLMRDRFNRVIYVGKARDLRKRVGSYFLPSKVAFADLKTRAMLDAAWDFETHTVQSEAESLLLEGKLIKEYRPRYNVSFRDDKRFLLVKVKCALRQEISISKKRLSCATCWKIYGVPPARPAVLRADHCPVRLIRKQTCAHWLRPCSWRSWRGSWNVSIFQISAPRTLLRRWSVFVMACRIKIVIGDTAF